MILVDITGKEPKVAIVEEKRGKSKEKKKVSKKYKAHQRYKKLDGTLAVGVTTVTNLYGANKRVLINWANRMGLQGINTNKYTDDKADIGTLAHAMITDRLIGKVTDTDDYSKNQIIQAKNSVKSFDEWEREKKIQVLFVEQPLVSEKYGFGGTLDIYAKINDLFELIDLKTGSGIYVEMKIQVAGYDHLLLENGHRVDRVRILNIPRADSETFQEQVIGNLNEYWEIFLNLLNIYQINKKIKGK